MTKRHRTFKTKPRGQRKAADKITFDLGEETYKCQDEVQGALILEFVSASTDGGAAAAAKIIPFITEALEEGERERFAAQLKSPDELIEMELLGEIVAYLIEEYSGERPTEESS